jgi:hypothetical protein
MRSDESLYRAERVRKAIASEPGVCELGIEVEIVGERVVLRGTVTSERRREQVLALVVRLCPDLEFDDEIRVEVLRDPKSEPV